VRSSIELLEEIIRDLMAMHLKLMHHRGAGRNTIGGVAIDEMIVDVDADIRNREQMLARFKAELAASETAAIREKEEAPGD
jgi:hypothetical protein